MQQKVDWEERRAELAEAVWRTIARRGLENTSIRNIAEESDWTRGVLQRYFRDKDELMLFAYELASDHAVAVNVRAVGDARGLEALRRRLIAYARPDAEQRAGDGSPQRLRGARQDPARAHRGHPPQVRPGGLA